MALIDLEKIRNRLSVGRFFKSLPVPITGHPLGYISVHDIDKNNAPAGSVQECNNMDFEPSGDRRRDPYSILADLISILPSGYTINNFHEKVFVDKDGVNKICLLAVALKSGSRARIFMNKYYNPTTSYMNNHGATTGWEEASWVELTEIIQETITNVADGGDPVSTFDIDESTLNANADYYNDWYVYRITESDSTERDLVCVGRITDYSKAGTVGSFTVKRRSYVAVEDPYARYIPVIANDEAVYIVRYPVVMNNYDEWNLIKEVSFEESFNTVKIACGHESRAIWLGFISDKTFFQGGFSINSSSPIFTGAGLNDLTFRGTYNGINEKDFIIEISTAGIVDFWRWKRDGDATWKATLPMSTNWVYLEDGISIRFPAFTGHTVTDQWKIQIDGSTDADTVKKQDGFWMTYDSPNALNKKIYKFDNHTGGVTELIIDNSDIGRELGIDYYIKTDITAAGTDGPKDRYFALCLTLDGFQTIFIKHLELKPNNLGVPSGIVYIQSGTSANFNVDFERRVTAHNLFYGEGNGEFDEEPARDNIFPETNLVQTDRGGDVPLSGKMIASSYDNAFNINQIDFMFHETGGNNQNDPLYLNKITGDVTLSKYLNCKYYKDIHLKAKKFIKVGENYLAVNLSPDSTNDEDKTEKRQGTTKVALSNVLDGNRNCYSIFASERIRSLAREDILGAIATVANQFLLFTKNNATWYSITDEAEWSWQNKGSFQNKGAVSSKGIASAVFENKSQIGTASEEFGAIEFNGVFWNNYDTIWGFFDNEPKDLLKGHWAEEYKMLSDSVKENCITKFYPNRREVFFYLNSKIYIYKIDYKQWKIYSYNAAINNFVSSVNGELLFHSTNKIYTTEPVGTTQFLDEGSIAYDFSFAQYLSGGTGIINKIANRLDLMYEMVTQVVLGEFTDGKINIELTGNESSTGNLHNKNWLLSGKFKKSITFRNNSSGQYARKRVNYVKLKVSSENTTKANIKKFVLKEMLFEFLQGGRKGTKI
ncbi:MAG: hypothetical protein HOP31_02300 [Ignavibacteria bacterium]|nr:hypothetical protein [Ignavibacteria bacterium]